MKLRYFSVAEAESLLPIIKKMLETGLETKHLIEKKVDSWRKVHKKITPAEEAVIRGQVDFLASQLEEQLGKIAELGCVPKDLDMGLIDFPTRINGVEGYLCWKAGEEHIAYWHGLTDGFPGRKLLPKKERKK